MTTLNLGIIDVPYTDHDGDASGTATGDIAGWLEEKYHIMRIFYEMHSDEIADYISGEVEGQLENILVGGRTTDGVLKINIDGAMGNIESRFRKFLDAREMEGVGYPGVPTKAALDGINHRFKNPYTGKRRPSFIDTGLYQKSFKAWVEE